MRCDGQLCLAFGLGAIGKTVSGYAMTRAGVHVTYADVVQKLIDDVNAAGGYTLATADIYSGQLNYMFISDVDAKHVDDPSLEQTAIGADYYISAVGSKGFSALLPRVMEWLKIRNSVSARPLYYLIFENDHTAMQLLKAEVEQAFGGIPSWLHTVKCSIERMSKIDFSENGRTLAVGETFFPIIADSFALEGSSISEYPELVDRTDNVESFYFRKLLTNNLGHAILGYVGKEKGYHSSLEAMNDLEIRNLLTQALTESGAAVCSKWGFSEEHMRQHIRTLLLRYANPHLVDDLSRLTRDPLRKLSPRERIVYPIQLCYQYGIQPNALLEVLHRAIWYTDQLVPGGSELIALRDEIGEVGILKNVCGAKGTFFRDATIQTKKQ